MTQILADGITTVAFVNGVLRIEFGVATRENTLSPSGTLLIPAQQAGVLLKGIINAAAEVERRLREKQGATKADIPTPPVAN